METRIQNDELFSFKCKIRNNIKNSLKAKKYSKNTFCDNIVGLSLEETWDYLKQTRKNNYGIEYNGEPYHIDHIKPLATAKTEEEVIKLCHYTNLQLLKPIDNIKKSNKLNYKIEG